MNDCIPFKDPGVAYTAKATSAVTGKRFLGLSGSRTDGPAVPANNVPGTALGGLYQVAHAAVLGRICGIAARDAASGADVKVLRGSGLIAPVTLETDVAFGQEVCVGANGQARAMVAAHLDTGVVGNNNAITWTAQKSGVAGNGITVSLVDPGGNNAVLGVVVTGNDIVVNLATGAGGAITSTPTTILAAIAASTDASALVTAANKGASTGAAAVTAVAATDLAGGAGSNPVGYAMTAGTAAADGEICLY